MVSCRNSELTICWADPCVGLQGILKALYFATAIKASNNANLNMAAFPICGYTGYADCLIAPYPKLLSLNFFIAGRTDHKESLANYT